MKFNRQAYVPYSVLLKQHEEAQKEKKVLDAKITGTVKWFSLRYHYGFIARDDGNGDVFVHQMNITKSRMNRVYLRSLAHNEKVEFDVVEGKSGPEASNVTGPDGTDVQGVYVIQLRYPLRPRNNSRSHGDNSPQSRGGNRRNRRINDGDKKSGERNDENKASHSDGETPLVSGGNRRRRNTSRSQDGNSPQSEGGHRRNRRNNDDKKSSQPGGYRRYRRNNYNKKSGEGNDENKAPHSEGENALVSGSHRRRRRNTSRSQDGNSPKSGGNRRKNDGKKSSPQSDGKNDDKKKSPKSDGENDDEVKAPLSDEKNDEVKTPLSDEKNDVIKAPLSDEENDEVKAPLSGEENDDESKAAAGSDEKANNDN